MAEKTQVGRLGPQDRPGLATWIVDTIEARDALTTLGDAGDTPIADADIGRVCRVGGQAPFRYFELVGVNPLSWAEFGAPGTNGKDGAPGSDGKDGSDGADGAITDDAPSDGGLYGRKDGGWAEVPASDGGGGATDAPSDIRDMSTSLFLPKIPAEQAGYDDNGTLGMVSIGNMPGAFIVEPSRYKVSGLTRNADESGTDDLLGGTLNSGLSMIQPAIQFGIGGPSPAQFSRFSIGQGDVLRLKDSFNGQTPDVTTAYKALSVAIGGYYDPHAPNINGDYIDLASQGTPTPETLPANTLSFRPFLPPDDSGIAAILPPAIPGATLSSATNATAYVYSAQKQSDGSYAPGELLGTTMPSDISQVPMLMLSGAVSTEGHRYLFIAMVCDTDITSAFKIGDGMFSMALTYGDNAPSQYDASNDPQSAAFFNINVITKSTYDDLMGGGGSTPAT